VQREEGSLDTFLWSFVGGAPIVRRARRPREIPTETQESRAMSRELKRRGFRFVGPTVCYSLMQATGMANDHEPGCVRYRELGG
jgi:DNA-3-methyladenine glycosylase I